jgi:HEPN domain-containing protein
MKSKHDLVSGWLRKAESDRIAVDALVTAGSLDAACFHAQQAVEKYLKAYLIDRQREFPFTHNLSKLLSECVAFDPGFSELDGTIAPLTPYAVELRYDEQFWPTLEAARQAQDAVAQIREFVRTRLPPGTWPDAS